MEIHIRKMEGMKVVLDMKITTREGESLPVPLANFVDAATDMLKRGLLTN